MGRGTRDEARATIGETMSITGSLGGNTVKYRREREKAIRAEVSKMYLPPRVFAVAKLCQSFGTLPGFALDLTTHDADGRIERALLLIGTPMCMALSA